MNSCHKTAQPSVSYNELNYNEWLNVFLTALIAVFI